MPLGEGTASSEVVLPPMIQIPRFARDDNAGGTTPRMTARDDRYGVTTGNGRALYFRYSRL